MEKCSRNTLIIIIIIKYTRTAVQDHKPTDGTLDVPRVDIVGFFFILYQNSAS